MEKKKDPRNSCALSSSELPLLPTAQSIKLRPTYRPPVGKKLHGMHARGVIMGCPGKSNCVYGNECPVEFMAEPPERWTACYLEALEYDHQLAGLRYWILVAREHPRIVDPVWMEEVAETYVEKRIRYLRFLRYVQGAELNRWDPEYLSDPIVRRFERTVTEQKDQLQFYLHELINLLRVAETHGRKHPLPGHHVRTAWFDKTETKNKEGDQKDFGTAAETSKSEKARRSSKKKPRVRHEKLYRAHKVKTIIRRKRKRSGA